MTEGEVLYQAGDLSYDFYVVLEGAAEIVRRDTDVETVIAVFSRGRVLGRTEPPDRSAAVPDGPGQPSPDVCCGSGETTFVGS